MFSFRILDVMITFPYGELVIYLQSNGFSNFYNMDITDLEDVFMERPELGRQVSNVYVYLYRLGGRIPSFKELDDLAKLIDFVVLEIDRIQFGVASEMLADFHTVICRWTIRTNKQEILSSLKEHTPGDGMGSVLLMDATYNYSMQLAERDSDVDFLLDLLLVCKWKTAIEVIKQLINRLMAEKQNPIIK